MKSINHYLTNYNNITDGNFIISDSPYNYSQKYQKINIYNSKINIPLQKIWIKTPKLKILNKVFISDKYNNQTISMKIVLGPSTKKINNFINFIDIIEDKVEEIVKKHNNNIIKKSSISFKDSFPPIMTLKLPYKKMDDNSIEFVFHIYNHKNKRINIDNIEGGIYASAFIELSDIWINGDYFGFNWNVLQMKLYPVFNFNKNLFSSEPVEKNNNECYHCLYCPNDHVRTIHKRTFMVPPPPSIPPPPPPPNKMHTIKINANVTKPIPKTEDRLYALTIDDIMSVQLKPVKVNDKVNDKQNTFAPSLNEILDIKKNLKEIS